MAGPKDVNAGNQNKFVSGNDVVSPNRSTASEDSADAGTTGAGGDATVGNVGSRPGPLSGHGFLSKSERPYAGDVEGRFEDRADDTADAYLRHRAAQDEEATVNDRANKYNNHGNVGWAGNYNIDWKVER